MDVPGLFFVWDWLGVWLLVLNLFLQLPPYTFQEVRGYRKTHMATNSASARGGSFRRARRRRCLEFCTNSRHLRTHPALMNSHWPKIDSEPSSSMRLDSPRYRLRHFHLISSILSHLSPLPCPKRRGKSGSALRRGIRLPAMLMARLSAILIYSVHGSLRA